MTLRLQSLRSLLGSAPAAPEWSRLLAALDEHIAALAETRFGIAGPTDAAVEEMRACLNRVEAQATVDAFPPYRSVIDWPLDLESRLSRFSALIVTVSARQFLPRTLFLLLDPACRAHIPALVLVTGLGRVRDPINLRDTLLQEAERRFKNCKAPLSFLTDGSFSGLTLDDAISGFAADMSTDRKHLQQRRADLLWSNARASALLLLRTDHDRLLSQLNAVRGEAAKAADVHTVLLVSAGGITAAWSNALHALAEGFRFGQTASEAMPHTIAQWCKATRVRFREKVAGYGLQSLRLLRLSSASAQVESLQHSLAQVVENAFAAISAVGETSSQVIATGEERRSKQTGTVTNLRRLVRVAEEDRPAWQRPHLNKETFASNSARRIEEERQHGEKFRDGIDAVTGIAFDQFVSAVDRARVAREMDNLGEIIHVIRKESSDELKERIERWVVLLAQSVPGLPVEDREPVESRLDSVERILRQLGEEVE
jgi:hypothetical protein